MQRDNLPHQKVNAEKQRQAVQERVREAIQVMRAVIAANVRKGRRPYPGRLTEAEIRRRAGGIDKNTLKKPYHATLRKEVHAFLAEMSPVVSPQDTSQEPQEASLDLEWYAQMLVAAQVVLDEAIAEKQSLKETVSELEAQVTSLKAEMARLRAENLSLRASAANVVTFPSSHTENP